MMLAFDTSVLIDIERNDKRTLEKVRELASVHHVPASMLFVSYTEFYYGLLEKSPKNFAKAYSFLQKFPLLRPTQKTAEILAQLRKASVADGTNLPMADLLIASQVLEHNLLLVTCDTDFQKIRDLPVIVL